MLMKYKKNDRMKEKSQTYFYVWLLYYGEV